MYNWQEMEEMQAELNAEEDYRHELRAEHWDYFPDGEYAPNPYRPDEHELEDGDFVPPVPNTEGLWDDD